MRSPKLEGIRYMSKSGMHVATLSHTVKMPSMTVRSIEKRYKETDSIYLKKNTGRVETCF